MTAETTGEEEFMETPMARTALQIIEALQKRKTDPRLRFLRESYRFDIKPTGSFWVGIDHGNLAVRESTDAADCVIKCSDDDFVALADGTRNFLTAFMQGRLQIKGDLAMAKQLHGWLPAANADQPHQGGRP